MINLPGAPLATAYVLRLLGGFGVVTAEGSVELPRPVGRLFAILGLWRGVQARARLAGVLWPDSSHTQALGNLRATLARAERITPGVLRRGPDQVGFEGTIRSDLAAATDTAHRVLAGAVDADVDGLFADLLPGWSEDWVEVHRGRHRELRLHALEAHVQRMVDQHRHADALAVASRIAAHEPFRESAHRLLATVQLARGERAAARLTCRKYAERMHARVGLHPSPLLDDLEARIVGSDDAARR